MCITHPLLLQLDVHLRVPKFAINDDWYESSETFFGRLLSDKRRKISTSMILSGEKKAFFAYQQLKIIIFMSSLKSMKQILCIQKNDEGN